MLAFEIVLERLILAFILSLIFGLERQFRKKPVGFGTFTFVSVGSCALALAAISIMPENPLPLLSGIITGIGFLGAGSLIRHQDKIFGATTAAAIWAIAAAGMLLGLGMISLGVIFYMMIFMIILMDYLFEIIGFGHYFNEVIITVKEPAIMEQISRLLPKESKCTHYQIDNKNMEHKYYFTVNSSRKKLLRFLEKIRSIDGVLHIYFE